MSVKSKNLGRARLRNALLAVSIVSLAACTSIGPTTIPRDRFDYNEAISNSWKEQTLLNVVKLRYADMPVFVEVASVVGGYTLETSVNAGYAQAEVGGESEGLGALGGAGKFTDRPTITYAPITGQGFNRSFRRKSRNRSQIGVDFQYGIRNRIVDVDEAVRTNVNLARTHHVRPLVDVLAVQ